MPFDPTLPANNSPIVSAELRNQFNALKALIDAQAAQIAALQAALNPPIAPSLDPGEDPPNVTLRVSQTAQTNAPEHWKVYSSDTGTGNPDSNPGDWTLIETIDGSTASGSDWFAETTADYTGKKVIAQYVIAGESSLWSDVVTQE